MATVPKFSKTPSSVRRSAPATPEQDNEEIYGEAFGWSAGEMAEMKEQGII